MVTEDIQFNYQGDLQTAKKGSLIDRVKAATIRVGLAFDQIAVGLNGWMAITNPYIAFIGAIKLRSKEVRVGTSSFKMGYDTDNNDLFTNITRLKESLKLNNLEKNEIISIIKTILNQNYFCFNNEYYLQKEGLAMGSPLSSLLGDIFMIDFENKRIFNDINPHKKT